VNVTHSTSNTKIHHPKTKDISPRPPVWRPQPIGLTRDELRAIVADMLG
jgi:hypothetical protein